MHELVVPGHVFHRTILKRCSGRRWRTFFSRTDDAVPRDIIASLTDSGVLQKRAYVEKVLREALTTCGIAFTDRQRSKPDCCNAFDERNCVPSDIALHSFSQKTFGVSITARAKRNSVAPSIKYSTWP